jgi:hypothetical protein
MVPLILPADAVSVMFSYMYVPPPLTPWNFPVPSVFVLVAFLDLFLVLLVNHTGEIGGLLDGLLGAGGSYFKLGK